MLDHHKTCKTILYRSK